MCDLFLCSPLQQSNKNSSKWNQSYWQQQQWIDIKLHTIEEHTQCSYFLLESPYYLYQKWPRMDRNRRICLTHFLGTQWQMVRKWGDILRPIIHFFHMPSFFLQPSSFTPKCDFYGDQSFSQHFCIVEHRALQHILSGCQQDRFAHFKIFAGNFISLSV